MNRDLLALAYRAWASASELRSRRLRCMRYTYGDQWSDIVRDSTGRLCREEDALIGSGKKPIVNNLIRQLVKTVVGRFRTRVADSGVYAASFADMAVANALPELDSRLLEEFLISGTAVQHIDFGEDVSLPRIVNVSLRHFFVNAFKDSRGWDIDMAGMLHDLTFPEVARRFSGGSKAAVDRLRGLFAGAVAEPGVPGALGLPAGAADFFRPDDPARCRVIELWTLDSHIDDGDTADSVQFSTVWHCRWLAPDGTVLDEYDSPFAHRSHPFVVKFYPLTDGEVHSFVEDLIDQQRSVNRLVVLIDKILATSAKGVLLFPKDQIPDDITWRDITDRWAQSDGVIPITGKGDYLPQQVMTNPGGSGAYQLLQLQMKLFDDISGVGDALLGRSTLTAKGAEMFEKQISNATIALADIFDTFTSLIDARNSKMTAL